MNFDGSFELEGITVEEVWLGLSDPRMIEAVLPGCQFLYRIDDPDDVDFEELRSRAEAEEDQATLLPEADPEEVAARAFEEGTSYAAQLQVGIGSVKPKFETVVTITEREMPEMTAVGEGQSSDSSFEMESWMELSETDDGVAVNWGAETDVFGRLARMGQRLMNPVANRLVNKFFTDVQNRLNEVSDESETSGFRSRISDVIR